MKFLLIKGKNLLTLLAHPDTGNQHNCNKMCAMLSSLFTEFIRLESTWNEWLYLNSYLLRGKGRSMNNIHFALGKNLLILGTHTKHMPQLYTVEQGKNTDRSDACDLWFHFQFLNMNFSAMSITFKFWKFTTVDIRKLKIVELVKKYFHWVQVLTHYCYWALFLSKWLCFELIDISEYQF